MKPKFESIGAAEKIANRRLPRKVQHFIRTGVGEQRTLRRNLEAFEEYALRDRIFADVSAVDTSTEIFGQRYAVPIVLAPSGLQGIAWPEGELAMARAARTRGAALAVSANAAYSMEDVATAHGAGAKWMQMSLWNSEAVVDSFLERAADAGYTGIIIITSDRKPATRHGHLIDVKPSDLLDGIRRLSWGLQFARRRVTLANFLPYSEDHTLRGTLAFSQSIIHPGAAWADLERVRAKWQGDLMLKGIDFPADVERALDAGVDGFIVSNTGGRGLDPTVASLDVLRTLRPVVPGSVPLLMDGGVRSGTDLAVACSLGADAVLIGRPALWGLAAGGQAGVERVIDIYRDGLTEALVEMGRASLDELSPECLYHYPRAS